jgi:hypothetical protein
VKGGPIHPNGPHRTSPHQAPRDCPVCGDHLATTRLGCISCGTEVSGLFESCRYCGLSGADQDMLRVFLVSRGNMKDVERFLGVSYPTARQRFAELLERLGLAEPPAPAQAVPVGTDRSSQPASGPAAEPAAEILRRLAAGELDVDEAEALLG